MSNWETWTYLFVQEVPPSSGKIGFMLRFAFETRLPLTGVCKIKQVTNCLHWCDVNTSHESHMSELLLFSCVLSCILIQHTAWIFQLNKYILHLQWRNHIWNMKQHPAFLSGIISCITAGLQPTNNVNFKDVRFICRDVFIEREIAK